MRTAEHRVRRAAVGSACADACLVLVFVVIGRASHHDAGGLAGVARTAWPFLAGLAVGAVATRAWRRPTAVVPAGVGVWLSTVAVGMFLRVASGQGTAIAFVAVALAFLGLFLLGWRLVLAGCQAVQSRRLSPTRSSRPAR